MSDKPGVLIELDDMMGRMPEEATRFIADFDTGKPVEPFAFETELWLMGGDSRC